MFTSTNIQRVSVSSTNLRSVGYDGWTGTLEVEFRSGGIYQHYDVPEEVYSGLMKAGSKGSYYYRNLRNRYGCTRIY